MSAISDAPTDTLVVRGGRTHNLQNIDLDLPVGRLIVVTGVSGSGKSSLAFDTIYAEGQRRYVGSLSAYARQFLERMERPDIDRMEGIRPAIAIRQKNTVRNPRSTVGTTTEIHDYLRLLYARVGQVRCRQCGLEVTRESAEVVAQQLRDHPPGSRLLIGFEMPVVPMPAGKMEAGDDGPSSAKAALEALRKGGFHRLFFEGRTVGVEDVDVNRLHPESPLLVVVDRVRLDRDRSGAGRAAGASADADEPQVARLTDSVETAYREGGGAAFVIVLPEDGEERAFSRLDFSERFECRPCGIAYEDPQPRLFSFNNPFGACPTCHGFGNVVELDMSLVVPDPSLSIREGAIDPWNKAHYRAQLAELKRVARQKALRLDVAWSDLSDEERRLVVEGDADFKGIRGFFRKLERKKYKVHVRVFLSRYRGYQTCPACGGTRLRPEARDVRVGDRTIDEVTALTVRGAQDFLDDLQLGPRQAAIGHKVLGEIRRRLAFLRDVGLEYLTLDRLSSTLSGGEAQRINLATALGSALVDTLYVLDEPSIGLHPRDNLRLIDILKQLRDQGNTVLVVEHDAEMIRVADYVVDLGLGAGEQGGRVVYAGPVDGLLREPRSLTAKYLREELSIAVPVKRRRGAGQVLRVEGATEHNLKQISVDIPLQALTCVTGVSGSGKSTLVHDVLYAGLKRSKHQWDRRVGSHEALHGAEYVSDVVLVDQAPIGRTPRSNPVTYLKAFDPIREIFSLTKGARARGLSASHFSFNVPGGRCEVCQGEGETRVEMQFLADVFVPCDECDGTRFKPQILEVTYRGKNVHQVLNLTVHEALTFFAGSARVRRRLEVLDAIGLGYLRLGQPATTLSGGEAQRVKIAAHLASRKGDRLLYVLDEPTTGLHFDDIAKLLSAFRKLLEAGHTLLVIEHNLDVIKTADYLIDLGPGGGEEGGRVVASGTPEEVAQVAESFTGRFLRPVLAGRDEPAPPRVVRPQAW